MQRTGVEGRSKIKTEKDSEKKTRQETKKRRGHDMTGKEAKERRG